MQNWKRKFIICHNLHDRNLAKLAAYTVTTEFLHEITSWFLSSQFSHLIYES